MLMIEKGFARENWGVKIPIVGANLVFARKEERGAGEHKVRPYFRIF